MATMTTPLKTLTAKDFASDQEVRWCPGCGDYSILAQMKKVCAFAVLLAVLLANIDGFWEPLLALLAHMRATQFIRASLSIDILKAERVEEILPRLRAAASRAPEGTRELAPEVARRL